MKYLYSLITIVLTTYIILSPGIENSAGIELFNICIAIICSIGLFSYENNPFSMFKIFNVFFLFFFCVAPVLQFKNEIHLLGTIFSEEDYIIASCYSLLVLIIFDVTYILRFNKHNHKGINIKQNLSTVSTISKRNIFLILLISLVVCFCMLWMNNFNIYSLFIRGGETKESVDVSNIASLFLLNFLRPMPMIILVYALLFNLRNKIILFLLFVLLIFSCPPTGVERFTVAAIYLPVLLQVFPMFKTKQHLFVLILVIGLLVIFPFLNNFRYFESGSTFRVSLNFDQFLDLHFDSFSMFMRVLNDNIITYGRQLLGVFFFWIPRSIWPDKPVGSGHYVAEIANLGFNNISMPFFAEGYINFGFLGVVVFTIILAIFAAKQDYIYWKSSTVNLKSWYNIKYYIFIGLFLFILRGDLMSSFAFLCGYLAAYYFLKWLLTIKVK